jgi:predicted O-linked N-acetylglucosamine transferase (SPINDLY family)
MKPKVKSKVTLPTLEQAIALQHDGNLTGAKQLLLMIVAKEPGNAAALYSLAAIESAQNDYQKALGYIQPVVVSNPQFAQAHLALSIIWMNLGQLDSSLSHAQKALALEPGSAAAQTHLQSVRVALSATRAPATPASGAATLSFAEVLGAADVLTTQDNKAAAVGLYRDWLAHNDSPLAYAVHFNLGVLLAGMQDNVAAEDAYRSALALNPVFAQAHLNLGSHLERLDEPEEALSQWRHMLKVVQPDTAENTDFVVMALNNLGRLLEIQKQFPEAEESLKQSLLLKPEQPDAISHWVHLRQKQCKWPVYKPFGDVTVADLIKGTSALAMLGMTDDPGLQLVTSMKFVAKKVSTGVPRLSPEKGYGHKKIRIAYLSSDFCSHAVSILAVELFELHNRDKFEVYGFCWSREDGSPLRARVVKAFDHYIQIGGMSDAQAAQSIRDHEIDILVDLHGLTAGTRPNILSYRPAPLQVTYLGFPGPTGLPNIDYVIADRYVLPEALQPYFTEKPLYMPNCFQMNDRQRAIGPKPTRASCKLPEDAFVYCAFNNNFKFTPEMFAVWMRILKRVPKSVLWIVADSPEVRVNLIREAQEQGVEAERIIYAERVPPADYIARYQVADLFLDTFPFNAGTTASDALWAGLPILTCSGRTFASRMAGSLLQSAKLTELVSTNFLEYENKAVASALDDLKHNKLKKLINKKRDSFEFFESDVMIKNIEKILTMKLVVI